METWDRVAPIITFHKIHYHIKNLPEGFPYYQAVACPIEQISPSDGSLVSGKVLCEVPQVLSAVVDGGFLSRERFEMQNDQHGHGERIGTPTNNGGCILAGLCSQS